MASIKRTPPIDIKGRFTLISPFEADPAKVYTCQAIRDFTDIVALDEDVFETYYAPFGLTQNDYIADKDAEANIITLFAGDGEIIYVPDTYIESYPAMGNIEYMHTVISVDLGALPDYINLDFLNQQILNAVSDLVNPPNPRVYVNKAPSTGIVTPADHEVAEAARVAGINTRTTDYANVKRLEALVDEQRAIIDRLNDLVVNGVPAIPIP